MIAVVIDALMWRQVIVVHDFVDSITLDPKNVPIVAFDFLVTFLLAGVNNAILEGCFKLDLPAAHNDS